MKRIFSEENVAGVLFVIVMVVFSFAHEDSKKRNAHYNVSSISVPDVNTSASAIIKVGKPGSNAKFAGFFSTK